jgi:hypothetical protein
MSEVSMSGKLPRGDANGLGAIARQLIRDPEKVHALIVLVDCTRLVTEVDTGETIPVMRIRRAEAIRRSDLAEAQRLVRRAWEERCGDTVLPMELEDDIKAIFDGFDPDGEPEQPKPEQPTKPDDKGDTSSSDSDD